MYLVALAIIGYDSDQSDYELEDVKQFLKNIGNKFR